MPHESVPVGESVEQNRVVRVFGEPTAVAGKVQGNEDSDRFDAGLIVVFEEFRGLLRQDLERVELVNGRTLTIDSAAVERMSKLASKSYAPQRVRVAGRFETSHYSYRRSRRRAKACIEGCLAARGSSSSAFLCPTRLSAACRERAR